MIVLSHMSRPPSGDAERGAEPRPQRLGVAHALQVARDRAGHDGASRRRRGVSCARPAPIASKAASAAWMPDSMALWRALDARHVDEAGRAAEQRAAGEHQLRDRLPAALGDGARAIGDALAALEGRRDAGMRLEALEFLVGREVGVLVVEVHDEADRHQVVAVVVEERAAAGAVVERPAERVLDEARLVLLGLDLPQLLEADAELLRLAALVEIELWRSAAWSASRARPRRSACTCRAAPCRA